MVICTYFLNNSCRFGSKCNNDHIDLSSVIKSEVDVTLKGNQWPLSCFGPFKERNSVPNFIEDLSFEEVRIMYLEAKMLNNIAGHQNQLAQLISDAKAKMQWITNAQSHRETMNVLIEIYNQPEDSSKAVTPTTAGNPFAATPMGTGTNLAANIFGGGNSGGFGQPAASAFGAQAQAPTGNIFGAVPNQTASNIFASSSASNIFAKPAQPAASSNIFGLGSLGQQQQQQPQTGSVFGGAPTFGGTGGSLFASVSQPVPANANPFGQQTQGGFGAAPPSSNLFASVVPNQAAPSPFAVQPAPSNPFGGTFGSQQQQPPASSNLFLPAPTQVAPVISQSPFGATMSASPFGANTSTTMAPVAAVQASNQFASVYSKMEDLNEEQLDAFKAERFELGKIPTLPPPKEFCN